MKHIFIINTHAGQGGFSGKLRKTLEQMEDFDYFLFNTRGKEKEGPLVKKIVGYFAGERLRIYCCGGSGTFRNVLNSIENLNNVELAFFPCGMANHFLKVFGEDEKYFYDIENLIHGKVQPVDYIETDHGRALNSVSVGLDTDTLESLERYRPFGIINGKIPYIMSHSFFLFHVKNVLYDLEIDGEKLEHCGYEVFFGNGSSIGGNAKFGLKHCADDGLANLFLGAKVNAATMLPQILYVTSNRTERTRKFGARIDTAKEISIRRADGKAFSLDYDGEMGEAFESFRARLVHKGLQFVVPVQVNAGFEKEEKE